MVGEKDILYAAAGDLPQILPTLLGRDLGIGLRMLLRGVDLRMQRLSDITDVVFDQAPDPVTPRTILCNKHGESFRATVLKEANGVCAPALGFWVTKTEIAVIDDWNLTDFNWQTSSRVEANIIGGRGPRKMPVDVEAHLLAEGQHSDYFAHHNNFVHPILNPTALPVAAEINALHAEALEADR